VKETIGKMTDDQEMEFTGKFKTLTTEVRDKAHGIKEDVFQEANDLVDRTRAKLNNKK
jgi:uncharacterized protein YjbJ (UPF0337 family)